MMQNKTVVSYETYLFGDLGNKYHRKADVYDYKAVASEACCDDMATAIEEEYVCFGEFEKYGANRNNDVNVAVCHVYGGDAQWDVKKIGFCPFCSAPVSAVEVARYTKRKTEVEVPPSSKIEYLDVKVD